MHINSSIFFSPTTCHQSLNSLLYSLKNCKDLFISQIGEVSFESLCQYTERPKTGQSAKKRDCGLLTLQGPSTSYYSLTGFMHHCRGGGRNVRAK